MDDVVTKQLQMDALALKLLVGALIGRLRAKGVLDSAEVTDLWCAVNRVADSIILLDKPEDAARLRDAIAAIMGGIRPAVDPPPNHRPAD